MIKKYSYEEVKLEIESKGCKLLSTEYVDCKTLLSIKCACGEIFETTFDKWSNRGKQQCNKCSKKKAKTRGKYSYEEVEEIINGSEGNGCKLKSKEYKNSKTPLDIECHCGNPFKATLNEFLRGKKQCNDCGMKNKIDKLSAERYIIQCDWCGADLEPMTQHEIDVCEHHFCKDKDCFSKYCSKKYSNDGNPNYNPNISEYDRKRNKERRRHIEGYDDFIKNVYERDNYTCQCCGKRGGDIVTHHLNGYDNFEDQRIDINNGIVLCEDCHKEYHKIYGYGNNTWQQFREFLYNKYLQTKDLHFLSLIETIDLRFIQLNNKAS